MPTFPVPNTGTKIQIYTAAPVAADPYLNGYRWRADGTGVYGVLTGGVAFVDGIPVDPNGRIVYVDATAGLPANTTFTNGLPISPAGALCISTGAMQAFANSVPFAANGAVAAIVT